MSENKVICLTGRIDANNAAEWESDIEKDRGDADSIIFDASELEYISSAGLRVLMKTAKQVKSVTVKDVSSDVYDIFDVTGFTELLDVRKKLREVSIEGCPEIGSGGYGTVYRIDPETIVKVYQSQLPLEFVEKERNLSQKAFVFGVPTAISYDVVKCGDSYGVVYELLNASTLAEVISPHPERVQELGYRAGKLLKELHAITIDEDAFPDRLQKLQEFQAKLKPHLEPDEYTLLSDFISGIPAGRGFIHGDYHAKNIMLQDDEFILIDVGDAGIGHPVFDIAETMMAYILLPKAPRRTDEQKAQLLGFSLEYASQMWGALASGYFGVQTPEEIEDITKKLLPYAQLQMLYQAISLNPNRSDESMKMTLDLLGRQTLFPAIKALSGEKLFF